MPLALIFPKRFSSQNLMPASFKINQLIFLKKSIFIHGYDKFLKQAQC